MSDFYINNFNEITYARFTLNKNKMYESINKEKYMKLLNNIDSCEKELKKIYEQKNNYKVKKLI